MQLAFNGYYGQLSNYDLGVELRQKVGFLAAHHGFMSHLPKEIANATEISGFLKTRGSKMWHEKYRFPTMGVTIFYGSVGNNELLGRFLGAYGFVELPLVMRSHFELDWKLGCGGGYTSKPFDAVLNPKQNAIGSRVNASIFIGIRGRYLFGKNAISLGLDLTHYSNAAFKVPNFGINLPYLSLGYARTIIPAKASVKVAENSMDYRKWYFGATAITTVKEIAPIGGKKYPIFGLSFYTRNFFQPKAGLELSVDFLSNQAIRSYEPEVPKTQWSLWQAGIYAAYLVPFDRFHFVFGMGAYVRDVYKTDTPVYHRIGMRYHFKNGLVGNFTLKTHFARADYFEYGIGYIFNHGKKK